MPDATDCLDRLLEITSLLGADARAALTALGLTESRAHLLWLLAGGPRAQRDLAASMGIAPRTVTGLVDGLVEGGFVTREPHPRDRRAFLVTPTAHGSGVLTDLQEGHRQLAGQLFGDLDEPTRHALQDRLDDLALRLRSLIGADDA